MNFSSIEFLLYFFPIFFVIYGLTPKAYRNLTLFLGSLVFYGAGEQRYLLLLMISVLLNYWIGLYLGKREKKGNRRKQGHKIQKKKTFILAAAIIANIGTLVLFKGAGCLPLGFSYYTFQIVSYLIDVYRGDIRREYSFLNLAVSITMFPRLVAGPIVNYNEVERELRKRDLTAGDIQEGLRLFIVGLVGKVLLADRLGILWHDVQVIGYESISTPLAWTAAVAYSMKLYFDFGGYSLMAVGLGKMLGFDLPANFRMPYMARSVRDFYRRWHMTLGRWFRKYIYIPLGGNRKGRVRTVLNLFIVWALTALWHGFTPNFWIWGGLLWLFITAEKLLGSIKCLQGIKKWKLLPHLYLWTVIPVTWMCFEITDMEQLGIYLGRMFGQNTGLNVRPGDYLAALKQYGGLFLAAFAACTPFAEKLYHKLREKWWGTLIFAALFWMCVWRLMRDGGNPFMYFKF